MKIATIIQSKAALLLFLLFNTLIGALWILTGTLYYTCMWYGPSLELTSRLPERTSPDCETSTDSWDDLTATLETTKEEAAEIGRIHGAAMVRNVVSPETATEFRNYILKANQELPEIALRFGEDTHPHRYHIIPPHTEPSVRKLFVELATHPALRLLVDSMLGEDSALVNFSVLTSEYGAKVQPWHTDAGMSASDYPEYFVKEYTLVVAMQDTTREMGATGVCPGMRICEGADNVDCDMQAVMSQGDVFLYSSDTWHRGTAHSDPTKPPRVFAFLSFAESQRGPNDHRKWPVGTDRLLNWWMFGHTLQDLATIESKPWRVWHAFGLFHSGRNGVRPWNLIDYMLHLYVDRDHEAPSVKEGLFADDLDDLVWNLVWYFGIFMAGYVLVGVPLVILLVATSKRSNQQPAVSSVNGVKTTKRD